MTEPAHTDGYKAITPQTARQIITDLGTYTVIIDVRRPDEFRLGHIKGAINLPLSQLAEKVVQIIPDCAQEIIVYCRTGSRSMDAAYQLISMGYTNVYDLGSIADWHYPLER